MFVTSTSASVRLAEPEEVLQMEFRGEKPTFEIHTKGTLLVDMASRVTVVRIWKTSPRAASRGNVSSVKARKMLQEC